jgi:hypothetical protein
VIGIGRSTICNGGVFAAVDLVATAVDDQRAEFAIKRGPIATPFVSSAVPQPVFPGDCGVGIIELCAEGIGCLAIVLEVIDASAG